MKYIAIALLLIAAFMFSACSQSPQDTSPAPDITPPGSPANLARTCSCGATAPIFTWYPATDDSGIAFYQVRMDGSEWTDIPVEDLEVRTDPDTDAEILAYAYPHTLSSGYHEFEVRAKDTAGNVSELIVHNSFYTWLLDKTKLHRYEDLGSNVSVSIPPGGIKIIPLTLGSCDLLNPDQWDVSIEFELLQGTDIEFWVTDPCGVMELNSSPMRMSSFSIERTWESYTYYLYFGNEFSTEEKLVSLRVSSARKWSPENHLIAANLELSEARVAIQQCMYEACVSELDAAVDAWDGSSGQVTCTAPGGQVCDAADYLEHTFGATYRVETDGSITHGTSISWVGIVWDSARGWVKA